MSVPAPITTWEDEVAKPTSPTGRRAAALLRVQSALADEPEPNRAQRRAAAKKARKA